MSSLNIKQTITRLSLIGSKDRQKGIQIILQIFNNITSYPQNTKYQNINAITLQRKFSNYQIWFELLLNAGFHETQNGDKLLFNMQQIDKLKYMKHLLLTYKFDENNNNDNDNMEVMKQSTNDIIESIINNFNEIQNQISSNKFKLNNPQSSLIKLIEDGFEFEDAVHAIQLSTNIQDLNNDNKQQSDEYEHDICCNDSSIQICPYFRRLVNTMNKYYQNIDLIEHVNMLKLINDYLHLMDKHDDNHDFAFIVNKFGKCDINTCTGYKRNSRDRSRLHTNWITEIFDKIHCYFIHSYDTGNRLSLQELHIINDEFKSNDDDANNLIINRKLLRIKEILYNKNKPYRQNKKCSQLLLNLPNDLNDTKYKQYKFGVEFKYGYQYEDSRDATSISEKHQSFKEELTTNSIKVLTVQHFDNEYQKALIHFNSLYCKQTYPPREHTDMWNKDKVKKKWYLSIELILSLMIYCNYDSLQYEFSKTYRSYHQRHEEFYHLGKNLKIAVREHGTPIRDGYVKTFYHGVGELLTFPKLTNNIVINCPLSTTSSFEVAVNFTNNNKGMIIEFAGESRYAGYSKYFSVSWLSDFANEKEYFFIQNQRLFGIEIKNILNVDTGFEYQWIVAALKCINNMVLSGQYGIENNKLKDKPENLLTLMVAIIHHQLSLTSSIYKPFKSLSEYAKQIINNYFNQNIDIETKASNSVSINYSKMKEINFPLLFDVFCLSEYEWIKMQEILPLFPNVTRIDVFDIEFSASIFEDILSDLKNEDIRSKLKRVRIYFSDGKKSSAASKYKQSFEEFGYSLEAKTSTESPSRYFYSTNTFGPPREQAIIQKLNL